MATFERPLPMAAMIFEDAERAIARMAFPRDEAISLKLRPVMWDGKGERLWNAYVYDVEYRRAFDALSPACSCPLSAIGLGERATLVAIADDQAVLIQHETGPELIVIAKLALATASLGVMKEAFSFFKELLKSVNDANETLRKEPDRSGGGRHHFADGVSLELRLQGEPRLLNGLTFPVVDEHVLDEFWQAGLDRVRTGEEWEGFQPPSERRP